LVSDDLGVEGLETTWTVDDEAPVEVDADDDGTVEHTVDVSVLAYGEHTLTLTTTDDQDQSGVDTIGFFVGMTPTVAIVEPSDGASFADGASIGFRAIAEDDALDTLTWAWDSSVDGPLTGATSVGDTSILLTTLSASESPHVVTITVTDATGATATDSITVTVAAEPVEAQPGDIVFSEMMINPNVVEDEVGEWVELYNPSGYPIDIGGYTFRDDDVDRWVLTGSIVVPAGGYAVLCADVDPAVNGGVPCDGWFYREYTGSGLALANVDDEVVLTRADGVDIDWLHYEEDWVIVGVAIGVDPAYAEMNANDDRSRWCYQTSVITTGREPGTPGQANDACEGP
jgi:hypothetical protein